jgi:hypothetical protein
MASNATTTIATTVEIAKAYVDRLQRVCLVSPYMKSITESTYESGSFDTFNDAGIVAPDAAPSGATTTGSLTGAYAYYIQFWDNNRSVAGSESAQSATVNPSGQGITVTNNATNNAANSRVTHWDIYRNQNGGSTYYFVARVAIGTTTYVDDNSDATIGANDTLKLDNDPPVVETYGLVHTHKNYMFLAGPHNGIGGTAYDDDFTWSKLANADAFPLVNRTKIERGKYGHIRAMASIGDVLVFYKDSAIYELHFDTNPSGTTGDGYGKTVNTERGALNHRCVVNVQGTHYVLDTKGIYQFRGGTDMVRLSEPLRGIFQRINWDEREKFSGVQDEDRVIWFVALDRDTECKYGLVLDLNSIYLGRQPRWYLYKFDFGIRDAQRIRFSNDANVVQFGMEFKPVAAFMTEYGFVGYINAGYRDLVAPQLTATGTVTSSTTTTITDSAATFTRTNDASVTEDVLGAYVRFITWPTADKPGSADWSQAYRITTVNSATQVTVTPAMPSAPPAGAAYVIGAIPDARIKTPLLSFGAPQLGKTAKEAVVEWLPGGANFTIGVEYELDRRGAEVSDVTASETMYSSTTGTPQVAVNMGGTLDNQGKMGARSIPCPARGFQYMQMILDASGVDKPAIVNAIGIELLGQE